MPAQWLSSSNEVSERVTGSLETALRGLSRPENARRLRRAVGLLLAVWAVMSLAQLFWALFPSPEVTVPEQFEVINPMSRNTSAAPPDSVNIEKLQAWHLFGEAGTTEPDAVAAPEPVAANAREGIEDDARETRLQLILRGAVASSQDGLGHAIIEYKKKQAVYAVEDKLPVSGEVVLAKVMQRQVVLDNGGTYELLTLFEDSKLDTQLPAPDARPVVSSPRTPARIDKRAESDTTVLAQGYRDRLYQNPQSLAEVVSVSAVREGGELLGYRISPGRDQEQFSQLGFKSGDLVTGINGIALNDPANTMRLVPDDAHRHLKRCSNCSATGTSRSHFKRKPGRGSGVEP